MSILTSQIRLFSDKHAQNPCAARLCGYFRKVRYFTKEINRKTGKNEYDEFCDVVWLRVVKANFRQGAV